MIIHELTEAECLAVLSRVTVGRLACARENQPYVVPISFYFDGTASLYSFSTVGQKIHWMRDNPKVCIETDDVVDRLHWTSVVASGSYEELGDSHGGGDELRRALAFLQQNAQWWLPATGRLSSGEAKTPPIVFRVRITVVSGRRTARPSDRQTT